MLPLFMSGDCNYFHRSGIIAIQIYYVEQKNKINGFQVSVIFLKLQTAAKRRF